MYKSSIFQILDLICNGAFGKVYRVKRLNSDDELYAMKILAKSLVIMLKYNFYLTLNIRYLLFQRLVNLNIVQIN